MAQKNNAYIPNIEPLIQAGINPATGLPIKMGGVNGSQLKNDIKRVLRLKDEANALNRFTWYNLPEGLDGNLIERILYYKAQAAFFYMPTTNQFFFLPYALNGTIDVYGRFQGITPLPFNGPVEYGKKPKAWIEGLTRKPVYDVKDEDSLEANDLEDSAVLLWDYSKQMSESNISRQILQEPLLDTMSEMIPFMRTSLIKATGVSGMRVSNEDEQSNVKAASKSVYQAALTGEMWIPTVGTIDYQDFGNPGGTAVAEQYMMAYQSLDNLRLSNYGLSAGGAFQKLGSTLQSEADMNNVNTQLILDDGLYQRQTFCNIVNSIWGLGIWCEVSDSVMPGGMMGNENEGEAMQGQNPAGSPTDGSEGGSDEQ